MVQVGKLDDAAPPGNDGAMTRADGAPVDASTRPIDASLPRADAAVMTGGDCPTGVTTVGAASSFVMGTATYFSGGRFYVVRDAGGLYALSSICTHAGCTVQQKTTTFYCNCHRATFTLNGAAVSGPVFNPLVHYPMCTLANGMLGVDNKHTVAATVRLTA